MIELFDARRNSICKIETTSSNDPVLEMELRDGEQIIGFYG